MSKDCIFILAGHCAGKSTLARAIAAGNPAISIIGGVHGADSIKDRASLYAELKRLMADSSVEAVILESAFVDNLPVVLNILKQGYHIQALYLKVTDATRGVRRNSKSPDQPASLTKKQSVSQSEAARLFIKLKDMAETHSVIRAGAINAEQEPEAVYAAAQRFIAAGERN